jgi:hypothetical protein
VYACAVVVGLKYERLLDEMYTSVAFPIQF